MHIKDKYLHLMPTVKQKITDQSFYPSAVVISIVSFWCDKVHTIFTVQMVVVTHRTSEWHGLASAATFQLPWQHAPE